MALSEGSLGCFAPTMGVTKLVALPSYAVAKALQARPEGQHDRSLARSAWKASSERTVP